MRKVLITLSFVLLSVVFMFGTVYAVQGLCSNCHTMHNSQDGAAVAKDDSGATTTVPNQRLLKAGCVSCHMAPTGSMNDGDFGPAVLHTGSAPSMGPGGTNAGGDFYWVDAGSEAYGHDVIDLPNVSDSDSLIGLTPPGFDATATPGPNSDGQINGGGGTWSTQLSCAGANGCHGTHSGDKWAAMKGTHHANATGQITAAAATTVGGSFRFLSGIAGYEDSDWQWTASTTDHNEYAGVEDNTNREYDIGTTDYAAAKGAGTISYLCAECHGIFHAKAADDSTYNPGTDPWRRHPTDISLPNYSGAEYSVYTTYSIEAPVGRVTIPSSAGSTVTPSGTDDDIVICLSCHRAHGSDQPDLLRWDYGDMVAGSSFGNTGCFTCHTAKD